MTVDRCTDWHHVTLLAVYQSLAISMRTMVKALPRAYAMPVCRPKVAGGSELLVCGDGGDPTAGRRDVGRVED